jgi:hypothetical protein
MTWFADCAPCEYFGAVQNSKLLAVGWLDTEHDFPKGKIPSDVYRRLQKLLVNCWQPVVTAGRHKCDLCQFDGESSGNNNLFIPAKGILYISPELITHYINAHHYQPPSEFCEAVLKCPDTHAIEYKKLLLAGPGRKLLSNISAE